ncbi:MAG TPA: carotenoid oxygenase family protein, partial [Gammaproteobacteria bacterium]|nr:carotenoid oxygenase family protein [Gammaproteobacteria bacterium]
MKLAHYSLGFTTLTGEVDLPELPCRGRVPEWLRGCLVRTGPARFEVGAQAYNHWFDGLAMLHKFSFANGRVGYANRYLRGRSYSEAMQNGTIRRGEFATDPERGVLGTMFPFIARRGVGDNGNVNVSRIGDSMVALTETPAPVRFDLATLETLDAYRYHDKLVGQITTAHPQFDAQRRRQYNYLLEFGRISKYHLYGIDADDQQRRRIATIPAQQPAYMHSFGMSNRYLILTEFPLVVNPLKLLLRHQPFIRNYRWQPELGTVFHIVDKETGEVVKTARSEPFFAFHHVNAFERGAEVVVDIVAYPDASVIDQLYLDRLQSGLPVTVTGQLRRFRIGLGASGGVTVETL